MGGHATHDDQEARFILSKSQFEYWGKRDPIGMYESHLQSLGIESSALEEIEERILAETETAEKEALASREKRMPSPETALQGVYAERGGTG
jgi:TPP-dependent pyruvate/acetoin dehydrogenase alpha subunit